MYSALMRVAALADQLQLGVVPDRLLELAARAELLERHQVVALEEADEVGCGHDERAVVMELHGAATLSRGRASSRVTTSRRIALVRARDAGIRKRR